MIGFVSGVLLRKGDDQVIVDCGGVGYLLAVSARTRSALGAVGGNVQMEVHTHVREDALALFGFCDAFEKEVFELLLSVSGVGPKMAMNVLSGLAAEALVAALRDGDLARLTQAPGVGKKTAERLVLELKQKAKALGELPSNQVSNVTALRTGRPSELTSALVNLGYRPAVVDALVETIFREAPELPFEEALRESLRRLRTG